jgi:toxin YoeB
MNLIFSDHAWEDYLHWQRTDKPTVKRIHLLIEDIKRHPQEGLGKPEPLKHALSGYWSRRIDSEHRLVYKLTREGLLLAAMRYHY